MSAGEGAQATSLRALLQTHYGHQDFRPLQLEAAQAVLHQRDVLLILPTGGGKSVTFQLPAVHSHKVTIVVTPLLALAKDQVDACNDWADIEAATWTSETTDQRKASITQQLLATDPADCSLRLLYTTPESLQKEALQELLAAAHEAQRLCCLAVDEAHCCSSWGHDFRPSYLFLGSLRDSLLPGLPCIAVTATASPQVRDAINEILHLRSPLSLLASFNRPNIAMSVRAKELIGDGTEAAVLADVVDYVTHRPGQSGIVYCRLRQTCERVAAALTSADVDAEPFHAGMDAQRRARIQEDWKEGGISVVVATIAFGMGIDKADVRYVVHFDAPASLEGLYQEAGRGGRDGAPAESVIYVSDAELRCAAQREQGARCGATAAVAELVQHACCRRRTLLEHFAERRGRCDAAAGEQLCDVCRSPAAVRAQLAAVEAKLVAAVATPAASATSCDGGSQHPASPPVSRTCSADAPEVPAAKPLQLSNQKRVLNRPAIPSKRVAVDPAALPIGPPGDALSTIAAAADLAPATSSKEDKPPALATLAMQRPRGGFVPPRRLAR